MAVLVFDFDGVIVDSFDVARKVVNEVIGPHIKPFDSEGFAALYATNFYEGIVKAGWPKEKLDFLKDQTMKRFAVETRKVKMFDGIGAVLRKLSKEYTMIIVTSNFTDVVAEYCKTHNIPITDIRGADVALSKTQKLTEIRKNHPHEWVYYIGDTVGDIVEALKAQVIPVGATWGFHSKEQIESAHPQYIVNSPIEFYLIFKLDPHERPKKQNESQKN